jgi:hypothetical protein
LATLSIYFRAQTSKKKLERLTQYSSTSPLIFKFLNLDMKARKNKKKIRDFYDFLTIPVFDKITKGPHETVPLRKQSSGI